MVQRKQNGHRWRTLRARVVHDEDECALCGEPVDKDLPYPHPGSPVVDHLIPLARGGPEYDRANLALMHRSCNRAKGTKPLGRARTELLGAPPPAQVDDAPIPTSRAW